MVQEKASVYIITRQVSGVLQVVLLGCRPQDGRVPPLIRRLGGGAVSCPHGLRGFLQVQNTLKSESRERGLVMQDRTLIRSVPIASLIPGSARSQTEAAHSPAEGLVTLSLLVFQVSPGEGRAELQVIQVGPVIGVLR